MTLQIRAIPRQEIAAKEYSENVPWHYKSGQSPDSGDQVSSSGGVYHDITNPGNPQTEQYFSNNYRCWYHDITNPGNPQTEPLAEFTRKALVPWHYKSGQSPDILPILSQLILNVPWHYKSGQSPDFDIRFREYATGVPWHYKSGQSPDLSLSAFDPESQCTMTLQIRAIPRPEFSQRKEKSMYHDITNPGNPQTRRFKSCQTHFQSTMTLQIRAIPRPLSKSAIITD